MLPTIRNRLLLSEPVNAEGVCKWFLLSCPKVKGLFVKKFVPTFLGLFMMSLLVLPVAGCSGGGGGTDSSAESIADDLTTDDVIAADGTETEGAADDAAAAP